METTFITIHDLSPHATILYSSDSVVDILGHHPNEIVGRSCWDFFHPDELPLARAKHGRGVQMDKAAVLSYCRMRDRDGNWVGCELVFTVVYDVLVGCTSVYKAGTRSQNRAKEAPIVRRLFSSSPRDPRYHMLSHLSSKFSQSTKAAHEPRAALFLNRYTRTLTIMYATEGLASILGISGNDLRGRSFYFCIAENCLQDAVRCLETAKTNDSIAYLRFWYRDPRTGESEDVQMTTEEVTNPSDSESGTYITSNARKDRMDSDTSLESQTPSSNGSPTPQPPRRNSSGLVAHDSSESRTSSDESANPHSHEAVFGARQLRSSSSSSVDSRAEAHDSAHDPSSGPVELEAVVSCTSDGMVVCLRRARPLIPEPFATTSLNGFFAVPWAKDPILPHHLQHAQGTQPSSTLAALSPDNASNASSASPNVRDPASDDFMNSIKECAVFAWGVTGINGTLAEHSTGQPRGEAQPPSGLAIWDPTANNHNLDGVADTSYPPADQLATRNLRSTSSRNDPFGDPGSSSIRP